MEKMYINIKNKVIEINKIEVIAEDSFKALCKITNVNDENIYETLEKPIKIYNDKEKVKKEVK